MATAHATPKYELMEVSLDEIRIEEGLNARTEFDPEKLTALSERMEDIGFFQTLTLRPAQDGNGYTLVAGERRFRAAKEAKLTKVPAIVGDLTRRDALSINWAENRHRADLNPIEEAQGLKALAEEWGLTKKKDIAEKAGIKDVAEVGLLFRVLELPEGVKQLIASGHVPVGAEKKLRELAAVSPRAAECLCEVAKRKEVGATEFLATFDDLLRETAATKFKTNPPTLINTTRPLLSTLVPDKKVHKALLSRIEEATGREFEDDAILDFGEEEDDAARALGCLIEIEPKHQYSSPDTFITDREVAADLAAVYVDRLEAAAKVRREAEEKAAEERARQGLDSVSEADKEAGKAAYAKREADRESAVLFNEDLGINLIKHRGGKARKQRSLVRGKAIAKIFLAQNPELASRGLRLVISQLQKTEQKELKSGKLGKPKTVFAKKADCIKFLEGRIDQAKSGEEAIEVVAEALIAGIEADQRAATVADQVHWSMPYDAAAEVKKLLGPDIKDVRPRRRKVKKGK